MAKTKFLSNSWHHFEPIKTRLYFSTKKSKFCKPLTLTISDINPFYLPEKNLLWQKLLRWSTDGYHTQYPPIESFIDQSVSDIWPLLEVTFIIFAHILVERKSYSLTISSNIFSRRTEGRTIVFRCHNLRTIRNFKDFSDDIKNQLKYLWSSFHPSRCICEVSVELISFGDPLISPELIITKMCAKIIKCDYVERCLFSSRETVFED